MIPRHRILCAKLPDRHLKFECSVLHSNVDFYFKFAEYSKFYFLFTALHGFGDKQFCGTSNSI